MDIESQALLRKKPDVPEWLKWVPFASLCVSFSSLVFAVTILYPWHLELSKEFMDLRNVCLTKENASL
jgi:hypothetical protein